MAFLTDPEYDGEGEAITMEGVVKLFEDLNVDPEDVRHFFWLVHKLETFIAVKAIRRALTFSFYSLRFLF